MNKLPGCRTFASCWGHPDEGEIDITRNGSWVNFTIQATKLEQCLSVCKSLPFDPHKSYYPWYYSVRLALTPTKLSKGGAMHGSIQITHSNDDPQKWQDVIIEVANVILAQLS